MANRSLLSFRHAEMFWHTNRKFKNTKSSEDECFQYFLEYVNISKYPKLSRPWLMYLSSFYTAKNQNLMQDFYNLQ